MTISPDLGFRERPIGSMGKGRTGGFALPIAILALVAVGLVTTGAIQLALRKHQGSSSTRETTQAFYVAESGMNSVLANWSPGQSGLRVWGPPDIKRGATAQGVWEVEVRRVGDTLFFLRSVGRVDSDADRPPAQQAVGVAARAHRASLVIPGALRTLGPVHISGLSRILGEDEIPPHWDLQICPEARQNLPAVVTPDGILVEGLARASSGTQAPGAHLRDSALSVAAFDQFGGMTWEDLTSLAAVDLPGGVIDRTGPSVSGNQCDHTDPMNWGDPENPSAPCGDYCPIIHLRGDATIRSKGQGQGILLADGNLDLRGDFRFFGLVIAQGSIGLLGEGATGPSVFGAIGARNQKLAAQQFSGAALLQYSRCAVRRAIGSNEPLARIRPLGERSWVRLTDAS